MTVERRSWWDGPWPWLAYLSFYAYPWLWVRPGTLALVGSAIGIGLFIPLYWVAFKSQGRRLVMLAAAIVAIGFALSPLGAGWIAFSIFAGLLFGRLRPMRAANIAVLTIALMTVAWGLAFGKPQITLGIGALLIVMTGMGSASREAFYDRTVALLASQEEVRRLAGMAERERMGRDLHDVVGRTLTLIAIKSDLAQRLVTRDPALAERETHAIGQIARDGLADVRAALAGQLGGSLIQELQASVDALSAAGIDVRICGDPAPVPQNASAILAMALREAITNTIRHSKARSCEISIGLEDVHAKLAVADDGVGNSQPSAAGSGLQGMRERLVAAGGSLVFGSNRTGFRLEARVPA